MKELIDRCESFMKTYQNNPEKLKKYQIIKNIIKEKDCFQEMDVTYAYAILRDLNYKEEELMNLYIKLIKEAWV